LVAGAAGGAARRSWQVGRLAGAARAIGEIAGGQRGASAELGLRLAKHINGGLMLVRFLLFPSLGLSYLG
jgi:hypothetical protein